MPGMAKREPARRNRRNGSSRASAPARTPARTPRSVQTDAIAPARANEAGLQSQLAFALGALAFLALPIAYQWTFRPASRPPGSDILVPVLELGGLLAAAAALLLGRRARAAGDRSSGAVWGPRLGAAAIVGYAVFFVLMVSLPS